ncbi:hypothetical protein BDZ91DRAFT_764088 [Kalaharituber pfeilii]|nr:hypothetical protein BDZ91DRAFT_764088 [Kalaharituber pfeilii]
MPLFWTKASALACLSSCRAIHASVDERVPSRLPTSAAILHFLMVYPEIARLILREYQTPVYEQTAADRVKYSWNSTNLNVGHPYLLNMQNCGSHLIKMGGGGDCTSTRAPIGNGNRAKESRIN